VNANIRPQQQYKENTNMDKLDIINSVVTMLVTDGQLHPRESEFLEHLCQRLDVAPKAIELAFENFVQGEAYVHLPQDESEKRQLVNYLLEAMASDGAIAPQEHELLNTVATRLGVPQHHFDDMLAILLKRAAPPDIAA
jgi:uncharacterized tellurite resistance protein B-like protein